jgi:hypothetical protein
MAPLMTHKLRRELPRNLRRENLAARVAQRAADRRAGTIAETPTPAPTTAKIAGPPEKPARKPAGSQRVKIPLVAYLLLAVVACFGVRQSLQGVPLVLPSKEDVLSLIETGRNASGASLIDGLVREPATAEPGAAEGAELRRDGHVSIPGGILVLPETFRPGRDGAFDLLIHFHGNTAVVRESAEIAKLDAAVAIVNLGIGSAPYEELYAVPGTYEELLETVRLGVERRGLAGARLRRVALSGWSAGYGAISTIAQVRRKEDNLDAILIFDGIHCGWENGELNHRQMKPFSSLAEQASRREIYFGITHSEIDPKAYASTSATADYLLERVGASRVPLDERRDAPAYLELESMKGAVSKKLEKRMEPVNEAHEGLFHVVRFRGDTKEHHMAHLFQMGATLLPELTSRWSR